MSEGLDAGPPIDTDYETTPEEDEYDRQALDAALAEGGESIPFRQAIAELGIDPDELGIEDGEPSDLSGLEDPDGPLVGKIISDLFREPNDIRRFQAVQALYNKRLAEVRRLTVRLMILDGYAQKNIPGLLGISAGWVSQLLEGESREGSPAYSWGRYLGAVEYLAIRADMVGQTRRAASQRRTAQDSFDKLYVRAISSTTVLPAIQQRAMGWARPLRGPRPGVVDEVFKRMEELAPEFAELGSRRLTSDEQHDVILGYHHSRSERMKRQDAERDAKAADTAEPTSG